MNNLQKHIADIIEDMLNDNRIFFIPKKEVEDLAKAVVNAVDEHRKEEWEARNDR